MRRSNTCKHCFTLFELVLCIAILGLISGVLAFQIRDMVTAHKFHTSVHDLIRDMRKLQIIALTDQIDIFIDIEGNSYVVRTDDPIKIYPKQGELKGVAEVWLGDKKCQNCTLHIDPNGRITPQQVVIFHPARGEKTPLVLDFRTPLAIRWHLQIQPI